MFNKQIRITFRMNGQMNTLSYSPFTPQIETFPTRTRWSSTLLEKRSMSIRSPNGEKNLVQLTSLPNGHSEQRCRSFLCLSAIPEIRQCLFLSLWPMVSHGGYTKNSIGFSVSFQSLIDTHRKRDHHGIFCPSIDDDVAISARSRYKTRISCRM